MSDSAKMVLNRFKFLFLIGGVFMLFFAAQSYRDYTSVHFNYNAMSASVIDRGMVLEGDIPLCFGTYEMEYSTTWGMRNGRGERYFYMIPVEFGSMMGYVVSKGEASDRLDKLTEDTFAMYESGDPSGLPETIHFVGKVSKMSAEDINYMKDALKELGVTDEEMDSVLVPYYITPQDYSRWYIPLILGIIFLLIGIILFIVMYSVNKRDKESRRESEYQTSDSLVNDDPENNNLENNNLETNISGTNVSAKELDKYFQ